LSSPPESGRDRFEWNARASQPRVVMSEPGRILESVRDIRSHLRFGADCLRRLPSVWGHYRRLKDDLFATQSSPGLIDSLGMGLSAEPGGEERVVEAFLEAGLRRALVRMPYRGGGDAPWPERERRAQHRLIELLLARECDVTVAVPQDRQAVTSPEIWATALTEILERYRGRCSHFQIGQAINRRKWGLWTVEEYLALLEPAFEMRDQYPEIRLVGPPVLDFEFHYQLAVLGALSRSGQRRLDRFCSQLYVDRQGAPESARRGWNLVDKCTALAAVGGTAGYRPDGIWITEVNWPLCDQEEFAPARGHVEVDETRYADYMVRYMLLALASGMVDRVYWWQLVSRGYGLIDDREDAFRRRPAFLALQNLVEQLRGARFVDRLPHTSAVVLRFLDSQACEVLVAWALPAAKLEPVSLDLDRVAERAVGRDGQTVGSNVRTLELGPSPTYLRLLA